MMRNFNCIILVLLVLFNWSCQKKESTEVDLKEVSIEQYYPNSGKAGVIFTIEATNLIHYESSLVVLFGQEEAEIFSHGKKQLLVKVPQGRGTVPITLKAAGQNFDLGTFTYQSLSVLSLEPTIGVVGTQLSIMGEGLTGGDVVPQVFLNSKEARVISVSDTLLKVEVVEGSGKGSVKVISGLEEGLGPDFQFIEVSSVKPKSGGKGTIVRVGVQGLDHLENIQLRFRQMIDFDIMDPYTFAEFISFSDTIAEFRVPENAISGDMSLVLPDFSLNAYSDNFTVVPSPVLESVSPKSGLVGQEVQVYGDFFSAFVDEMQVLIGDDVIPIQSVDGDRFTFVIPEDASSGPLKLIVNDQVSNTIEFKIQNLKISDVLPANAAIGSVIEIHGDGFSPNSSGNQVLFNGVKGDILEATDKLLKVQVPKGASSGELSVLSFGQTTSSPQDFLVQEITTIGQSTLRLSPSGGSITVDDEGNVYVLEIDRHRIVKFDPNGNMTHFYGSTTGEKGYRVRDGVDALMNLDKFSSIKFDTFSQAIYVSEANNSILRKVAKDGSSHSFPAQLPIGNFAILHGEVSGLGVHKLIGIRLDRDKSNVFLSISFASFLLEELDEEGYSAADKILFPSKYGDIRFATGTDNYLYGQGLNFSNTQSVISRFDFRGAIDLQTEIGETIHQWAGSPSARGYRDGKGSDALFNGIRGIISGSDNTLLVLDQGNRALRRIKTHNADVSTVFKLEEGFADGDFRTAKISNNVSDLAVSPDGKYCYILDNGNNCIRKVQLK